jgi:O-acetyl-ADP-ribose deacetylase (regulator of RNase III)
VFKNEFMIVVNNKVRVQVLRADIIDEKVDAITSTANRMLDHSSGLAGSIVSTGGPSIQ